MRTNSPYKTIKWLLLSSLMAGVLTACPSPVQDASFEVSGKALGSSFVDGTSIQPLEAIVTNISAVAGTPPNVSFNTTSDLEFQSIDSILYKCEATSEIVVLCSAIDGAKLEGAASTSLKPVFDVVAKNTANFDPTSTATSSTRATTRNHLLNVGVGINSAVLQAPILLDPIALTAATTGFDLSIAKTVSQPFIAGATGEFTLTASVAPLPLPAYVKVQDPPLPLGYTYNYATTNTSNPAWTCVPTFGGGIQCTLKPSWVAANPNTQPPPIKVTVNVALSVTTTTQINCPWVYPALGDTNLNNNHLGPLPYTTPCTPYTPIKIDLGITKTQNAPLTTPANSFYWGLPGQYTINVHNYSTVATSTPIVVTDVLTNQPTGGGLALGPTFTVNAPWTCTPLNFSSGPITCTYTGSIPAGGNAPPLIFNFMVKPENAALAIAETNCATLPNDVNNQNNSSCVQSQNMALEGFDLQITKTHVAGPILNPAPGTPINYILNVQNNGTGDAPGPIVVTDTLPAAFSSTPTPTWSVVPASAATCMVAFPTITCTSSNSLPASSSFVININATTNANATGNITNTATVSSGAYAVGDSNLQNNTSSDVVTLATPCTGTFNPAIAYATNQSPHTVKLADINGDTYLDAIAANLGLSNGTDPSSSNISVFINNGAGVFAAKQDFSTGGFALASATGDVNGDGKIDVVVANFWSSGTIGVLLNTTPTGSSTVSFASAITYVSGGQGTRDVLLKDVNNDSHLDVITVNEWTNNLSVFLNNSSSLGTFLPATLIANTGGSAPWTAAAGQIDSGSTIDLIVGNWANVGVSLLTGNGTGTGTGTFTSQPSVAAPANPTGVVLTDLNADGKLDIVSANKEGNSASVMLGNGNGTFAPHVDYATSHPVGLAAGDLNCDGKVDVVTGSAVNSTVAVLLGVGSGTLLPQVTYPTSGNVVYSVALGDLNHDGKLDIVTAHAATNNISVLTQP